MDNQAKGLVPPSGPQRDQFIEKIKADFSSSIGNALEKAGMATRHTACIRGLLSLCSVPAIQRGSAASSREWLLSLMNPYPRAARRGALHMPSALSARDRGCA